MGTEIKTRGNICMILGHDYPDIRLSREAYSLVKSGYGVTVISYIRNNTPVKDETVNGVRVVRIKYEINRKDFFLKKLNHFNKAKELIVNTVVKINPDVIHCNDLEMMWVGLKLKKILKKKLVYDRRENWPEMMWVTSTKKNLSLKLQVFLAKILEKIACRKADHIIVVVDEAKEKLVKMGIHPSKITVIMNTEKMENYTKDIIDDNLKEKLIKSINGNFIIVYTGWFGPHRGLESAIQAMPYILKNIPHAKLLLVGDGNNMENLKILTKKLKLEKHVIFTGRVPSKHIQTYMSIGDIGLIPHLSNPHTEATIPNKLFQYMLLGKPIVASDLKPLKRIINETKCGVVYEAGNPKALAKAVIQLANSPEIRKKYGDNGLNAALKKYNWQEEEKKLIKLYNSILEG